VTEAWPHKPYTFRALRKTFGALWVRCDVCRRYAALSIGGLQEVDYRSKTFSCSQCGSEVYLAVIELIKEAGMQDYRLDAIERPEPNPTDVDRLSGRRSHANVSLGDGRAAGPQDRSASLIDSRRLFKTASIHLLTTTLQRSRQSVLLSRFSLRIARA
jgi:hypothetical protein